MNFFDAATVILSLVLIEGLLSVDNALGIAAFAKRLPASQRQTALRVGFIGAYAFRVVALLVANWITENRWVMLVGAGYLIYLMCAELTADKGNDHAAEVDDDAGTAAFWPSVLKIGLMDLSLSVDNVVTAVAFTKNMWLIYTGVLIGILVLRFFAGWCLQLIARHPFLEKTAFLLVGYVGLLLLSEQLFHFHAGSLVKFAGVVLIVAASFLHAGSPALQRALQPVVTVALALMKVVAVVVHAPFVPVVGLFRRWTSRV